MFRRVTCPRSVPRARALERLAALSLRLAAVLLPLAACADGDELATADGAANLGTHRAALAAADVGSG
ncbi:MAG TPA: hypothetical protein VMG12_06515, partial [Polyangiaceae bacterium]|nr:hypothetical protein [Polyangiaceae bacterium]